MFSPCVNIDVSHTPSWLPPQIGLFAKISLQNCPNLAVLLQEGETLSDLLALSPEEILLRWFNYHLEQAGHPRRVHNFSGDIKDSECYTVLLNQIAPPEAGVNMSPLSVCYNCTLASFQQAASFPGPIHILL